MIELTTLNHFLTENHDLRLQIALFMEPEAWGYFSQPEAFARFEPFLQELVLSLFPDMLCFSGKTKEESLFLLLQDLGIRLPSSGIPARYRIVCDYIQRIRANPARVAAEQKVMFALMFPRWLRSVLSEKERQVAHIMAVLLQNIRSDSPVQEVNLATQLTQWLFCGKKEIYTVLSTLWRQGHVRLVLQEMLDKIESGGGQLSLSTEADLNRAFQNCFIELKDFCQNHALGKNSSLEAILQKASGDDSLFNHSNALELLVLSGVDCRHMRFQTAHPQAGVGLSLLHIAVSHGYLAMVERLLTMGVDPNLVDSRGETALHLAVLCDNVIVVERLLAAGVDVNLMNAQGQTALHIATIEDHTEIVERLLASGVGINLADEHGETSLHWAVTKGHTAMLERFLAASVDVNVVNVRRETVLHWAAVRGHTAVVERLLAAGVDPNRVDAQGGAVLHWAAFYGHVAVVEKFLSTGVDVNLIDAQGESALHLAAVRGHAEVIELLIEAGIDCKFVDLDGKTALDVAVDKGHEKVVERLQAALRLDATHPVNAPASPLHRAVGRDMRP